MTACSDSSSRDRDSANFFTFRFPGGWLGLGLGFEGDIRSRVLAASRRWGERESEREQREGEDDGV